MTGGFIILNFFFHKDSSECKSDNVNCAYAPISGKVISLEDVNDIVFSQHMMGDGIAIIPQRDDVHSPVNGIVKAVFPTKHAIGILSDDGAEIIIHIGIETVMLNGEGFDCKVSINDTVKTGQLLANVDFKGISKKKYDITTIITLVNIKEFAIDLSHQKKVKVGDLIFKYRRIPQ